MNYLAIIVCAIAAMIIGMVWHSKALFGKAWMQVMGVDPNMTDEQMKEASKGMVWTYIAQFILSLIEAFILALFVMMAATIGMGIMTAAWIFVGFMLPIIGGAALWSGKPKKLAWKMFGISAGFHLVTIIVYSVILTAWR